MNSSNRQQLVVEGDVVTSDITSDNCTRSELTNDVALDAEMSCLDPDGKDEILAKDN